MPSSDVSIIIEVSDKDFYLDLLFYHLKLRCFIVIELKKVIHFSQEAHETNAVLCFYKKERNGKYLFEVVSKAQDKEFEKSCFSAMEDQLRGLVIS